MLEQIELAEGVQAIAIRLGELRIQVYRDTWPLYASSPLLITMPSSFIACLSLYILLLGIEDEDELYEADTLTSPPRLYLALTDNGRQIDGDFDRQFVEILNGLTISCNLLPVEPIINMDEPASLVSDSGLEKFEATEEEEEITFPSLDISSDTAPPPALATTPPATTATSDSKIGHQGKETLKIEIPTRRSYSVPEILSVPLTHHQIVSAWKNTSMPPWMTCTHFHHVHGGGESYQEERQVEREPETPELSSPTSSITTIMDTQLVTPILSEAPQSLYIHSREFSTDTVITAATSVHSDAEMQERKLHLESEDYKSKQELQRRDPFGLGILIHGMDQARSRAGPPTSATDEEHLAKIAPTSASVNHVHHQEPLQNTMEACPTVSSTFDTNKPNRHMYERNEIMLVSSGDGMLVEKQSKLPLRLLSAGSSKSIIRGGLRPLPQRGVVSDSLLRLDRY